MSDLKPFWLSWYHHENTGPFELHFPWWISGYSHDATIVCAAVRAEDEGMAQLRIEEAYDRTPVDPLSFRFCEERSADWSPFCDRFPKADWMQWGEETNGEV